VSELPSITASHQAVSDWPTQLPNGGPNDRHIRGYSERTCPPLPPKAAEFALLHARPLSTRSSWRDLAVPRSPKQAIFWPIWPSW
jgi:hypothetical protein